MKRIITLLFLLHIMCQVYAANPYKKGDFLTVFYYDGLNLRKAHDIDSEVLDRLSFGTRVKVIDDSIGIYPFEDYFTGKDLKGFWVKIITKEGKTGYMFDGYLSQLQIAEVAYDNYNGMESQLEAMLTGIKITSTKKKNEKKGLGEYEESVYANGWAKAKGKYNDCEFIKLTIPDISSTDALLLVLSFDSYAGYMRRSVEDKNIQIIPIQNGEDTMVEMRLLHTNRTLAVTQFSCPVESGE